MSKKKTAFFELIIALILIALVLIPQLIGTTTIPDESAGVNEDGCPVTSMQLGDLEAPGTRFGTLTIGEWEAQLKKRFPEGTLSHYNNMANMYTGLEAGEIDAAMGFIDERKSVALTHPDMAMIEEPFATIDFGFGTQKTPEGEALCRELNKYLAEIRKNGEYEAIHKKWEDPKRDGNVMAEYSFSGEKGTLRIATSGNWTPKTFYQGETLTGEFVEIVNGFCQWAGYRPKFETVANSAEVAGLASGTYDICADTIEPSEERLEIINVTDALMTDQYYLYVPREPVMKTVPKAALFFQNMKDSIRRTLITEDRYKILLSGLGITIRLSIISCILGTLLGALICFLRTRNNPFASAFASLYIRIFRSLPVVVLLLVLAYIVFRKSGLDSFWVCVITFSIEFSAYCSEIFRSGIDAVPSGQARAAKALGFGKLETFWNVVWPQAMVHLLPAYSGQLIATVKMTAVAGYIAIIDLTKAADIIRSRTYEAFFPLFITSVTYFFLCYILVLFTRIVEKRIHPEQRAVKGDIVEVVKAFDPDADTEPDAQEKSVKEEEGKLLLKAEHLKKSFGDVTPLKDVSCEIKSGDVVAIIGPSGTGKSTLLNLLNHLEKADSGSILFDGQDTCAKGYDENRMRQQIGMVFQSFNLFSHLTVIENLMLAQTKLKKRSRKEACERGMALLKMVGLADKALSMPSQLSGGQQQRVAIVRAMAMDPKIILFDEPTSALDPTMIGEVLTVIKRLTQEGLTMLIVTHEMRFARDVSNRVFYMDEGIIYEEGRPEELFETPKKDKTRQFIHHLQVFETTVRKSRNDAARVFAEIEQFGSRYMLSRRLVNRMLTVAEELLVQTILPMLQKNDEIRLVYEYTVSEGDEGFVNMKVAYPGQDKNPLAEENSVSLTLVRNVCRDLEWQYHEGECSLEGKIVLF